MNEFLSRFGGSDAVAVVGITVAASVTILIYFLRRKPEAKALDYQRRQTEIAEGQRREELERAKMVDIQLSIRREPGQVRRGRQRWNDYLDFVNAGAASARNVNLESFTPQDSGADSPGVDRDIFPLRELLPGASASCAVQIWGSSFEAVITWEDSGGYHRETRTITR
jgi:hypothetical protein